MGKQRHLFSLAVALLAGFLVTGCIGLPSFISRPSGPTPAPQEAGALDAEEYANAMGVSLEEAQRQLALQEPVGRLGAELQTKERATFCGLWIEHQPRYRVVACFTRDGEQTLRKYVTGGPLQGVAETVQARFSLEELRASQARLAAAIQALPGVALEGSSINVIENRVELFVADGGAQKRLGEALRDAGISLPDYVTIVPGVQITIPEDLPPVPLPDVIATDLRLASGEKVRFLHQIGPTDERALASGTTTGQLAVSGGCVELLLASGERLLPLWPSDFTARAEGNGILVLDGKGQAVARTGDRVRLRGLALYPPQTPDTLAGCPGPYHIVAAAGRQ